MSWWDGGSVASVAPRIAPPRQEVADAAIRHSCEGDERCERGSSSNPLPSSGQPVTIADASIRITRVLEGDDTFELPSVDITAVAAAAGTSIVAGPPPALTALDAAVEMSVLGDVAAAHELEAGLGAQLADAAAQVTGVGDASSFKVTVEATMPPSPRFAGRAARVAARVHPRPSTRQDLPGRGG